MSLESLANELLLDLFEYFSGIHLLRAFHGLNARFDTLLFVRFRAYRLDFRSVSKQDFDTVCQQYLPLIVDRVLSLRLSDDNETPQQIDCFLSLDVTLCQLTHLRSLSLSHVRSTITLDRLIVACHHLSHLTHLDFTDCAFRDDHPLVCRVLNSLWSLPKLTHCHFDVSLERGVFIIVPSMISTSLEYLSIESYCYGLNASARLFRSTPCLRHLCVLLRDDSDDQPLLFTIPSMITLKLSVYESATTMTNLLQSMPNLCHLIVETDEINIDGHRWEQIIVDHLPKLKVFRLKMLFRLQDDENKERRVDELLTSFRTRFWLDERQWFVQCDWDRCQQCDKNNIYLYTLPYAFRDYYFHEPDFKSKSTCCRDDAYSSYYNHVHSLGYELIPSNNRVLSHFRFFNLHHLDLYLPADDHFWSVIPRFDQLISLKVAPYLADHDLDPQFQLQALLDRAPRLHSLKFANWPSASTQMPPFEYLNKSVRQLDLQDVDRCYDSQRCATLSRSSLGIQCEVLSIAVENRTNIIDLINTMTHLRALNVICRDDVRTEEDEEDNQSLSTKDELIEWLQHRLPSTYTITRNDDNIYSSRFNLSKSVRLWIR